jgi:hypothetical protein
MGCGREELAPLEVTGGNARPDLEAFASNGARPTSNGVKSSKFGEKNGHKNAHEIK